MPDPKIRLAKSGDEAAIHEAHMRSIREVCVKDHGEEEVRGWGNRPLGDRWKESVKSGNVWVVESESGIGGVAYIRIGEIAGRMEAHIHALYLTPEVLGRGFGRRLMEVMLEHARAAGAAKATLDSTITAHEFYRRFEGDQLPNDA